MAKQRKFTIKIRGKGQYTKPTDQESWDAHWEEDGRLPSLQKTVKDFFDTRCEELDGTETIIKKLESLLVGKKLFQVNSKFTVENFEYLGNDIDPDDVDTFE